MTTKRILLIDTHKIVREGFKSLIEKELNYKIVAEAESAEKALEILKITEVNLIIMDICLSKEEEIRYIKEIKAHYTHVYILILTMQQEAQSIRTLIEAGVKGYMLKSSGKEELLEAIQTTIQGHNYFSDAIARIVMMDLVNTTIPKDSKKKRVIFSDRELDIVELIVNEYTNQEIADQLFISVRTVDAHRRNLLKKIGARNTVGLVKYAIEHRLLKGR